MIPNHLDISEVETRPTTPWTKYHYAILTSDGVSMLFDTLRYENAFLCRKADVKSIKQAMKGLDGIDAHLRVLICKYGEGQHGGWTYARLLSTQRLHEIALSEVVPLNSDFICLKPPDRPKHINEVTITAMADEILDLMFKNHAMPATEADAHIMEQVLYQPEEPITVKLRAYSNVPGAWDFGER